MSDLEKIIVARVVKNVNGKSYLEVDNKPFLYNAVQSWYPPEKDYTTYIQKAAEANYKCMSFWLYWKDLEPTEGERNWTELDKVINLAVENDIRVDIIWGGTNFCNHIDPRFTPDWIINNESFRQKDKNGEFVLIDGRDMGDCYVVDAKNQEILNLEKTILKDMLEHIAEYDKSHRVIAIQLENEINLDGYYEGTKQDVLNYINELGKVVKGSDYEIATRVNIFSREMDPDIDKLEYIEGHGLDTYAVEVCATRKGMLDLGNTRFKYIAENAAFENSTSHIVTALANGGFYNIYKVDYDVYHKKPGIYGADWSETENTVNIRNLNAAMNKIGSIIAESPKESMLELNTETDTPENNYATMKDLKGVKFSVTGMDNNPVGLVVEKAQEYYCVADKKALFLTDTVPILCQNGYINEAGIWVAVQNKEIKQLSDNACQITYEPGECIKIKF